MYPDNTLTPKEATRLCALGTLALGPMSYSTLANAIRHFISRVIGPSLDVMGTSVELLKYEGLVTEIEGHGDEATLTITEAGREEMHTLLTANIRVSSTELNKLVVTLKFRFLHLLDKNDQCHQADLLADVTESELARLEDLRQHHADNTGHLIEWLDHDIEMMECRLKWLEDFRNKLYAAS